MRVVAYLLFVSIMFVSCKENSVEVVEDVNPEVISVLNVEDFDLKLKAEENPQLIDVRTIEEFKEGHIVGASSFDVNDQSFADVISDNFDKSKPVYLYCKAGNRSNKAAQILKEAGFTKIYDLDGGYQAWIK